VTASGDSVVWAWTRLADVTRSMRVSAARPTGEIRTHTAEAIGIPTRFAPEITWFRYDCDRGDYRLGVEPTKSDA